MIIIIIISALEEHISVNHYSETIKSYQCTQCNERFMSEWRLKMHERVHAHAYAPKFCHYYNNSTFCPYEKFGCKFSHSDAEICKFDKACKRKLCPFKHNVMITNSSYSNSNSSESNV